MSGLTGEALVQDLITCARGRKEPREVQEDGVGKRRGDWTGVGREDTRQATSMSLSQEEKLCVTSISRLCLARFSPSRLQLIERRAHQIGISLTKLLPTDRFDVFRHVRDLVRFARGQSLVVTRIVNVGKLGGW